MTYHVSDQTQCAISDFSVAIKNLQALGDGLMADLDWSAVSNLEIEQIDELRGVLEAIEKLDANI